MRIPALVGLFVLSVLPNIALARQGGHDYSRLSRCARPEEARLARIYAESLCGDIAVFENRELKSGRKIKLHVMVIRSREAVPRPDPVFFLAGGPGQAATDVGPAVFSILDDIRKDHDIVLVDQRGTGASNSLACKTDDDLHYAVTPLEELQARQIDQLRSCLAGFDADPSQYTTPIAMDDLDEVRRVLGFDKINLYGISYGTRAALVYLRRHEETVRSVVLDSVVPLTMSIPANVAIDAQRSFDRMLSDCKASKTCNAQFPDLADHFNELLQRLRAHPMQVQLTHPLTGKQISALMEPATLTRIIRSVLYDRTLSSLLPLAIHLAWTGNYQPIVTLGYALTGDDADFSLGMMASVLCSEDMREVTQPNNAIDFDNAVYNTLKPICDFWPRGKIPDGYFQPVKSNVPTLLIAGKLDPITPPQYALEAAETLSDAQVVIAPGVGHSGSLQGCIPTLLAKFIEDPAPKQLDTSCVAIMKRPDFFTSLAGTAPVTGDTDD